MKFAKLSFLLLICFNAIYAIYPNYVQHANIRVYADNQESLNAITNILDKFHLRYESISDLNSNDNAAIYIIAGKNIAIEPSKLPTHYILYQMNPFSVIAPELTAKAIAVWDVNRANTIRYKNNNMHHYYYLPHDQHTLLDPIILPCFLPITALQGYKDVLTYSNVYKSDISEHLPALYCHCIFQNPNVIVEAGIRWGDGSTVAIRKAHDVSKSYLIGLDINDCSKIYAPISNACFLQMSDLNFPEHFTGMNRNNNKIDFAFIDTSHLYDHALKELELFESLLSEHGAMALHDTNPLPTDPQGVRQALKDYYGLTFDIDAYAAQIIQKNNAIWQIVHYPYCNGMTVIQRLDSVNA